MSYLHRPTPLADHRYSSHSLSPPRRQQPAPGAPACRSPPAPRLLPWWRHCCTRASAVLELGANVGYFTVQGATAAPGARYVAVEPHPVSAGVCRANLALNGIGSVELLEAAAVPGAGPSAVELQVPADQLATPT